MEERDGKAPSKFIESLDQDEVSTFAKNFLPLRKLNLSSMGDRVVNPVKREFKPLKVFNNLPALSLSQR